MRRLSSLLLFLLLFLIPGTGFAAYESQICTSGSTCTQAEVGPFMKGIAKNCGNVGDCSLGDIVTVFVNVGNWVVGIIGAVVLLMYVVGGFHWLASGGRKEWVDKGKKYMTISTVGMLIVMFSYLGIYALRGALQFGTVRLENENYVTCTGEETEGDPCGLNAVCVEDGYVCQELCYAKNATQFEDQSPGWQTYQSVGWACIDRSDTRWVNADTEDLTIENFGRDQFSGCVQNLCSGPNEVQCCQVTAWR